MGEELNTTSMKLPRIHSLDSIRGIAALTVLLNHVWESLPASKASYDISLLHPEMKTIFSPYFLLNFSPLSVFVGGLPAVIMFFVLSGFVLSLPWHAGRIPAYRDFAVRRLFRIYLPYLMCMLGVFALGTFAQSATLNAGPWSRYWLDHPVNLKLLIQHLSIALSGNKSLDPPAWSLVHEIRISLIFPVLILLYMRCGVRFTTILAFFLYAMIWAISKLLYHAGSNQEKTSYLWSGLMTFHYIPFFLAGIVLASYYANKKIELSRQPALIRGALWIGAISGMSPVWWKVSSMGSQIIYGMGSILLIALSLDSPAAKKILAYPPIRWLGRVSFSLYLIHMPLLYFFLFMFSGKLPVLLSYLIALAFIGTISEASYRWVERPSISLGRRFCRMSQTAQPGSRFNAV
jgi:peptidoglycan/LPS O-acetylase OafA/YrhL